MKIQNRERLRRKLAALPKAVKEEVRKGLAVSAAEIVDLQKRIVPVDTGNLRASIGWEYGDQQRIKYSQGVGGDHELSVRISAGDTFARHAHLIEFGTVKMRAQPFFYPAYRLGKKRAKSRISRATNKAARKVAGK